jgi:hypothetical protein
MDAELRADEHDRLVDARHGRLGPGAVLLEHALEARDALERRRVPGREVRGVRRQVGELPHRVLGVDDPRVRVERAEQRGPVGVPRPAVVERDPGERRQLGRQPPGELGSAFVRLPRPGQCRDVHDPRRAHSGST